MNCKQFRMMKGLDEMKKVQQAILRYINLDLGSVVETFEGFICDESCLTVTVPYQQNLDFILIRLQGLSKLLIRVVECSKRSASFFLGLIKAGSFYTKGVIFVSTLASVWSQSRQICKSVVTFYNKLRKHRESLKKKPGLQWVENDYTLPEKLEIWLAEDYERLIINATYDMKLLIKDNEISNFLLTKDDMSDQISRIQEERFERSDSLAEDVSKSVSCVNNEVELEDFTPIARNIKTKTKEVTSDHSKSSLTSKDSVASFIKNETLYRKVDPKKSLTINKMKKKVWKEFKDDMKNKLLLMQESAFIDYVNDYLDEYKV